MARKATTGATKTAAAEPWKRNIEVGKAGRKFRIRSQQFKSIKRRQLEKDPLNWRLHGDEQVDALRSALSEIGFVGALLVRKKPGSANRFLVMDGHARFEQFAPDDLVPCCVVAINDNDARKLLASYDPVTGMATADRTIFEKLIAEIDFDTTELEGLVNSTLAGLPELFNEIPLEPAADEHFEEPTTTAVEKRIAHANALVKKYKTARGQLWLIPSNTGGGVHRLVVGDVTHPDETALLLGGAKIDLMLSDPPFCSGGFQESGKRQGSIGTDDKSEEIHGDRLSTRGFKTLVKAAFKNINPATCLIFTDWRMWLNVNDVVESEGHAVRQMIVWDKTYPGFGAGFRAQHELVLFGAKGKVTFDKQESGGNVFQCKRTGNKRHPSEKPIDLLLYLLRVHGAAKRVCDPFAGSGPTFIACEQKGRTCYGMEIVPRYAAEILERCAEAGMTPKLAK